MPRLHYNTLESGLHIQSDLLFFNMPRKKTGGKHSELSVVILFGNRSFFASYISIFTKFSIRKTYSCFKGESNKLYLEIRGKKKVTRQAEGNSKLALLTFSLCPTFMCV